MNAQVTTVTRNLFVCLFLEGMGSSLKWVMPPLNREKGTVGRNKRGTETHTRTHTHTQSHNNGKEDINLILVTAKLTMI